MVDSRLMRYALRPLREEDIPQASAIDREAFPTTLPPISFRREMRSRLARYLVAWDTEDDLAEEPASEEGANSPGSTASSGWRSILRRAFNRSSTPLAESREFIVGFLGLWLMPEEGHITSIAVRNSHQGQGIGELLLQGSIELAIHLNCRMMTLECRVSNIVAQNLYKKYGFRIVGRRKGYYSDNHEDAFVMTVDNIDLPEYQERLRELQHAHSERWGVSTRYLQ